MSETPGESSSQSRPDAPRCPAQAQQERSEQRKRRPIDGIDAFAVAFRDEYAREQLDRCPGVGRDQNDENGDQDESHRSRI
jgi:hypothetical protein